jgi:hypothetical protein
LLDIRRGSIAGPCLEVSRSVENFAASGGILSINVRSVDHRLLALSTGRISPNLN